MANKIIKTIRENTTAELIEKKSKFIASIYKINSISEAEEIIKQTKKKYYDARHNCFAFSVLEENQKIVRQNDDGEPSGTAGEPILNIIKKNELENILIVVTRYFGGILLGAGGLTRAYSNSSIEALKKAKIVEMEDGIEERIEIDYGSNDKFRYYCEKNNIKIINTQYAENIFYIIELNEEKLNNLKNMNIDNSVGKNLNIKSYVEICRRLIEKEK